LRYPKTRGRFLYCFPFVRNLIPFFRWCCNQESSLGSLENKASETECFSFLTGGVNAEICFSKTKGDVVEKPAHVANIGLRLAGKGLLKKIERLQQRLEEQH
jgi:hypothetical protein